MTRCLDIIWLFIAKSIIKMCNLLLNNFGQGKFETRNLFSFTMTCFHTFSVKYGLQFPILACGELNIVMQNQYKYKFYINYVYLYNREQQRQSSLMCIKAIILLHEKKILKLPHSGEAASKIKIEENNKKTKLQNQFSAFFFVVHCKIGPNFHTLLYNFIILYIYLQESFFF